MSETVATILNEVEVASAEIVNILSQAKVYRQIGDDPDYIKLIDNVLAN